MSHCFRGSFSLGPKWSKGYSVEVLIKIFSMHSNNPISWMHKSDNRLILCSFFSPAEQHQCKKQLLCPAGSWRPEVWSRTPLGPALGTGQQRTQRRPRHFHPRSAQFPRPLQSRYQWTESQHTGDHVCLCTCQSALMLFTHSARHGYSSTQDRKSKQEE